MHLLMKDTPGFVRKPPDQSWKAHIATADAVFAEAKPHKGGYVILRQDGWEFMVLERHLNEGYRGKKPAPKKAKRGTFNKRANGPNGKGASRRKNMRRR